MVPVHNDEDVIEEVLEYLISQGIEIVIVDNGSTDNTFKLCQKFLDKGVLEIFKYSSDTFIAELIFRMLYDLALKYSPDWVILNASDEFLESGIQKMTLKDRITQADKEGYNLIQFDRFDFFMTNNDEENSSIRKKLRYYSYQGDYVYRAWKFMPSVRIGDVAGHYPIFPNEEGYRIFPEKFVMRHYPFRDDMQSKKKVESRIRGTNIDSSGERPVNAHYKKILNQDMTLRVNYKKLTRYGENGKWNYKIEYTPHETFIPPKREEVFTNDGKLKNKPLSRYELNLLLNEKNEELRKKKIKSRGITFGKKFIKKFKTK